MSWLNILLLLLCPLMMIFCMKGMMGGHKHHDSNASNDLHKKMATIEAENKKLRNEIDALSTLVKKES
jgi:cell division protein FtsB